jgi:hypothetical protein
MFLDLNPDRHWDEPTACKSCKRPILSEHATEQLQMPFDAEHKLHELNGVYHSECARPYLSLMRARNTLGRFGL